MLPPEILIKRQGEVLRAIRSCRMAPELRGPLLAWVPASLSAESRGTANLRAAALERSMRVRDGIHRAADAVLTERMRSMVPRRSWARIVRHRARMTPGTFGLERCPCLRVVRKALNSWEPTGVSDVDSAL
jgi:hypothetical protein